MLCIVGKADSALAAASDASIVYTIPAGLGVSPVPHPPRSCAYQLLSCSDRSETGAGS